MSICNIVTVLYQYTHTKTHTQIDTVLTIVNVSNIVYINVIDILYCFSNILIIKKNMKMNTCKKFLYQIIIIRFL